MNLSEELSKIETVIKSKNLNIDVYKEHIAHEPQNIIRLYITCKSLGGLLISNGGDGWTPCFPKDKNYPFKGTWFSTHTINENNWIMAIIKKLDPETTNLNHFNLQTAIERNAKNIDPFRRHTALAIFKNLLESEA